jgi:putative transposase
MSHSLSIVNVHLVFAIKNQAPLINADIRPVLFSYMGGLLKINTCLPIAINGPGDHVHSLFTLGKNIAISEVVEQLKRKSSKWIKSVSHEYSSFYWQRGYGVFSVGLSKLEHVRNYIINQERHHMIFSFEEERSSFLVAHGLMERDWDMC